MNKKQAGLGYFFLLAIIPFAVILIYEIILFDFYYSIDIEDKGLTTTIPTNLLTFPMTFIWLTSFELSCEKMDNIVKIIKFEGLSSKGDSDVENRDTGGISKNNGNIIQVIVDKLEEFDRLTKAWSPMLFVSITSESVLLVNAGFTISKYTLYQNETNFNLLSYMQLGLIAYLITASLVLIYDVYTVADYTHNNVKKVASEIT